MRILIDGSVFTNSHQIGIQRYFSEILERAAKLDELDISITLESPAECTLPAGCKIVLRTEKFPVARKNIPRRALNKLKRSFAPTKIPGCDVFHSTYFTCPGDPAIPQVLTVYDMLPEIYPFYFGGDNDSEIERKRRAIFQATKIIAISETTKKDLIRVYPEVTERVKVIHLGADHLYQNDTYDKIQSSHSKYVLFVGERMRYKNFTTVADAMESPYWPKDIRLALAGRPFSKGEELNLKHRGLLHRMDHYGRVTDEKLAELYRGALGFIFASVSEGFGFPMLESQSLSTPVIASDCDCFREVGGDAFIPFPHSSQDDLAAAVNRILDPKVRTDLVERGQLNVRRFSWEKCTEETIRVWQMAKNGLT
jgi:glycosyltransferase involved in cell wall biosynthesis